MTSDLRASEDAAATARGDDAYERIRHDVLTCAIMPGAIVSEAELMRRYGIARTSCRVALVRLVHEGFARAIPRQGYRISPITLADVEEIFTLRAQLEPMAARLACGNVDTELLARLDQACEAPYAHKPIGHQIAWFLHTNRKFHLTIAAASGNARLYRTLAGLMDDMARLVSLGFGVQGVRPGIEHDHEGIIEAFAAGNGARAEALARRHIETFLQQTKEQVFASLSSAGTWLPYFSIAELRK
ncbi:GntR family transcriptional regulator [Pandoraea nosoerga]|uniref:GntR family transcriptional regulator n=1 Tax=Pandoraea nosoerga TaxID=2508296 RepID=A0A5E4RLH2_9BURK|nr:GntR family transcriptional regulator [Pandoraea nosoerga]MBN4664462.1 GntR family transcriptional regulator [Pandoraea nosoerga]MBN4674502.1 GntR family transcriptional regulator [Pandoraea nosoerga]MBN4679770.1 GntR family transcriptional regulator [Pandoraea nosoerga]MBN4743142.1 GntR family transcriptional regulator [Pandoraea nosoerga]VVD62889.1 GntR family transcriptional regulator [Pandoraea nosoerga]